MWKAVKRCLSRKFELWLTKGTDEKHTEDNEFILFEDEDFALKIYEVDTENLTEEKYDKMKLKDFTLTNETMDVSMTYEEAPKPEPRATINFKEFPVKDFYNQDQWLKLWQMERDLHEGIYSININNVGNSIDTCLPISLFDDHLVFYKKKDIHRIFFDKAIHQFCLVEETVWSGVDETKPLAYSVLFIGRIAGGADLHVSMISDECCYGGCSNLAEALQFLDSEILDEFDAPLFQWALKEWEKEKHEK